MGIERRVTDLEDMYARLAAENRTLLAKVEKLEKLVTDPASYFESLVREKVKYLDEDYAYSYIAADCDGRVFAYKEEPELIGGMWSSTSYCSDVTNIDMTGLNPAECIFFHTGVL